MAQHPIALRRDAANVQHYEVRSEFVGLVLGPWRKYFCCLYRTPADTPAMAEEQALAETAAHAGLADDQNILELGRGWGSLSMWTAEKYLAAPITAVSNSRGQRQYIEARAAARGFGNLRVITADRNDFASANTFDRVVSVDLFEHMTNWKSLLHRLRGWLRPDGLPSCMSSVIRRCPIRSMWRRSKTG